MPCVRIAYRLDRQRPRTDLPSGLSAKYLQGLAKGKSIPPSHLQETAAIAHEYTSEGLTDDDAASVMPTFSQDQRAGKRVNEVRNSLL